MRGLFLLGLLAGCAAPTTVGSVSVDSERDSERDFELVASLEHVLADAARRASTPAAAPELSDDHKERLRSLGYLDSR